MSEYLDPSAYHIAFTAGRLTGLLPDATEENCPFDRENAGRRSAWETGFLAGRVELAAYNAHGGKPAMPAGFAFGF